MRGHWAFLAFAAMATAAGCIPARDNPSDPSNRPSIEMEVTVGGRTSALGGRSELWRLDATGSRAKHGELAFEWSISSDGPTLVEDVISWIPAGASAVVLSTSGSLLLEELVGINDFTGGQAAEPGTGTVRRWIRLAAQDDGGRVTVVVPITVTNSTPLVDLGVDRRIAPGGQWWTAPADEPLDAAPWDIVIEAEISDADGDDEGILFTAGYEGRWTVEGALSVFLDADANGLVDSDFLENGGRRLHFSAPLFPTQGEVGLEVWDVLVGSTALSLASSSVRVDVRTAEWVLDYGLGDLSRPDTSMYFVADAAKALASDGRRALVGIDDPSTDWALHLKDHRLQDLAPPIPVPTRPVSAVADGVGGWWYTDFEGKIGHLREESGELVFDKGATRCPPSPYASCVGNLGTTRGFKSLAPTGTGSVWALGFATDFSEDRLVLIATSGLLVEETAVPGATGISKAQQVVVDGNGDVWIAASAIALDQSATLRRRGGATEDLPGTFGMVSFLASDAVVDRRNGSIYLLGFHITGDQTGGIFERNAVGGLSFFDTPAASQVVVDGGGDLLLSRTSLGGVGGIDRYRRKEDGFELVESRLGYQAEYMTIFEGGSLLVSGSASGALQWIEAGARASSPLFADVVLVPTPEIADSVAIDPVTGQIWLARRDADEIVRFAPDGTVLSVTELPDADRVAIAIDPLARAGWVITIEDPDDGLSPDVGALWTFAIDDTAVTDSVALVAASGVGPVYESGGLAILPGERLCVGGYVGSTPSAGFAIDLVSGQLTAADPDDTGFTQNYRAFAHPREGSCWFFDDATNPSPVTGAAQLDAAGVTTVLAWPSSGNNADPTGIADLGSDDLVFAISRNDSTDPWLGWYSPGNPLIQGDPSFPSLQPSQPPIATPYDDRKAITGDAFYGHFFVAVDNGGGDSLVLRLDRNGVERDRYEGPRNPVPVCR